MTGAPRRRGAVALVRLITLVVVLGAWEAFSLSGVVYQDVVPALGPIASAGIAVVLDPSFYYDAAVTIVEVLVGYAIATAAGIAIGVALGLLPFVRAVLLPYVNALATTPKIIFLPIVMLAFGVGPLSKMALGAVAGFFPVVLSTAAGILQVDPVLVRVARSYNLTTWQVIRKVYLPAVRGPIITGMRLGLGTTVVAALLAEIKFSNAGLGFLAIDSYNHFRIAELYAILVIIFLLTAALNALMARVERAVSRGTSSP
jgi:ABC-type nitrate/sulfonate/bicarbonate transport system permease component